MRRSLNKLIGYKIDSLDGKIGSVHDFYFDEAGWVVRYLVVDTGSWLPGRMVLLSPLAVADEPDWREHTFPVSLTKSQIENSPAANADKPVSRQYEDDLHRHYGWPVYWGAGSAPIPSMTPVGRAMEKRANRPLEREEGDQSDPLLRSMQEVNGYHIQATDGEIGHVYDMIADTDDWTVRYLVVDTRNWMSGRKVLLAPEWLHGISWPDRLVKANLARDQIAHSPEFDPAVPVNRNYEVRLYDYYGRPVYW